MSIDRIPHRIERMAESEISDDGKFAIIRFKTDDGKILSLKFLSQALDIFLSELERTAQLALRTRQKTGNDEPVENLPIPPILVHAKNFRILEDDNTKEKRLIIRRERRSEIQVPIGPVAYAGLCEAFSAPPSKRSKRPAH